EGGLVDSLRARWREPVRPFPARLGTIDRAFLLQRCIERAAANPARALMLQPRVGDLVVMAIELDGARIHEVARVVVIGEAAHIERPEIEAGLALDDPLGHHAPGP